MAGGEKWG